MPVEVLVVGSVNVDLVVSVEALPGPGETVAGGTFSRSGGGKGANQAVAAARCGADVALVGAVGEDDLGTEAVAELDAEGIDTAAVARLADVPTGVAAIVVDASGENQIAVASGANTAFGREAVLAALRRADVAERAVLLVGLEISDEAILAAIEAWSGQGPVILNPAPARPLPEAVLAGGPLLTPNAGEATRLTGLDDPVAAARVLRSQTGTAVVVSLGARGALLVDGDVVEIAAPEVEVVDATGAGDALNGALAAEFANGSGLEAALTFAVRAATLSTRAAGARAGMPARAEV